MIKRIGRRACLLLLASLLVGAIFVSFQGSATFAQIAPEEPILVGDSGGGSGGGAGATCPDPLTCGNFGCHPRSIADPTLMCSRYKLEGTSGSCPSPVPCT